MQGLPTNPLKQAYGWDSVGPPTLLHHGENQTFAFIADSRRYAARLCRRDADRGRLASEAAWLTALAPLVAVPPIVATATGDHMASVEIGGTPRAIMVFGFIDGEHPDDRDPAEYRRLGAVMRRLHEAADSVLSARPQDWAGRRRPRYEPAQLRGALDHVLHPGGLIDESTRVGLLRIAEEAASLGADMDLGADRFIHADLHPGNLLDSGSGLVCLDFEECGFGPRVIDLGVVRFHLAGRGPDTDLWQAFLEGYGPHGWSDGHLALGAVLRILYAVSKIPDRLDVPDIAGRAPEILRRYLGICKSLLSGA